MYVLYHFCNLISLLQAPSSKRIDGVSEDVGVTALESWSRKAVCHASVRELGWVDRGTRALSLSGSRAVVQYASISGFIHGRPVSP